MFGHWWFEGGTGVLMFVCNVRKMIKYDGLIVLEERKKVLDLEQNETWDF